MSSKTNMCDIDLQLAERRRGEKNYDAKNNLFQFKKSKT